MPCETKDSFPGKTCLYDSHKILPGVVFIVKGTSQDGNFSEKMYFGPVPTEIESVSETDFVGLTSFSFCFCLR